jgi:hypothetical protein
MTPAYKPQRPRAEGNVHRITAFGTRVRFAVISLAKREAREAGKFRHHRLWPQNSVSRQQRQRQAETGSNAALLLGKVENLVLLAPSGGQVGEASNPMP